MEAAFGRQRGGAGDDVEGEGLQGVAGEEGGGFAVCDVAGGFAAPQTVVVHGGHVVVDEGVGVDEFDGGHGVGGGVGVGLPEFGGGEDKQGAQAFAAAEDGVAHGAVQLLRGVVFRRHEVFEQGFGLRLRACLPVGVGLIVHRGCILG